MKPGIYSDISMNDYQTGPGWSKSHCDQAARSAAHLASYLEIGRAQTEAFSVGEETHRLILEPDTTTRAIEKPDIERRSKANRRSWVSFFNEHNADANAILALPAADWDAEFSRQTDKILLTAEQFQDIKAMRESVFAHPEAGELLENGLPEQSQYWIEPTTGLLVRNRFDWIYDGCIPVDLKTTVDASPNGFSSTAAKFRYHVQEAIYVDGFSELTGAPDDSIPFVFIVVEKTPPYAVGVYRFPSWARERGRGLYQRDLRTIKTALDTGVWGAYSDEIEVIDLPKWAY